MSPNQEVAALIARNVRLLRSEHGWSLDALAARSGVSKGMLVAIEGGRGNPSIGTLVRVSEAFGVAMTRLIEAGEQPTVRIVPPERAARLWQGNGESSATLLIGADRPAHLETWDWHIGPGDEYRSSSHARGTREVLYVLQGSLTLHVDQTSWCVSAGAAALFDADRSHAYENAGEEPVHLVMVVMMAQHAEERGHA